MKIGKMGFVLLISIFSFLFYGFTYYDAPPNSLMDSTANPKVKTTEGKRIGAHSLARSTLGVERACRSFGMGTRLSDKQVNYSHEPPQIKQQGG